MSKSVIGHSVDYRFRACVNVSAAHYGANWGTNERRFSKSRLSAVPVWATCRWRRVRGGGVMMLAVVTLQMTVRELVLGSRPSWGSWPNFRQRTDCYYLSVVGRHLRRGCRSVRSGGAPRWSVVYMYINSFFYSNAKNYEVEKLCTGPLSVQAV